MRLFGALLATALCLSAGSEDLDRARKLYDLTEYDESLKILQALPKDGAVYELMGRSQFMNGNYKKAAETLEQAVAADPRDSNRVLWLARSYGRWAEVSNPFSAMGHASKARQSFERAVQLNPQNIEALNDLLEYYLEAPGFLGGGFDKARKVAQRIGEIDPAEGHWAQAKLNEKHREFGQAEAQLRRAIELAPHQVGRVIDLARFLSRQGRYQEADQSFARAEEIAPHNPVILYAKADAYIRSGRHLDQAKSLLQQYLNATISPDDPPKQDARKLLRQIKGS